MKNLLLTLLSIFAVAITVAAKPINYIHVSAPAMNAIFNTDIAIPITAAEATFLNPEFSFQVTFNPDILTPIDSGSSYGGGAM